MEYLERGFQEANEVRIGGAAKLHESLFSDKAVERLRQDSVLKGVQKGQLSERKRRQFINSNSRLSNAKLSSELNLDNMYAKL